MFDWFRNFRRPTGSKTALLLLGGGARNAYQIGVLRAISDTLGKDAAPFDIYCGSSAGAINVAMLANHADDFAKATSLAERAWANLSVEQVFEPGAMVSMYGLMRATLGGGPRAEALLDNTPLANLLNSHVDMDRIRRHIDEGALHALSVATSSYHGADSVTFFDGHPSIEPWHNARQRAVRTDMTVDHLMASTAIPMIFPAVKLDDHYYGDGSVRLFTPMRTPINMGADKILAISVSSKESDPTPGAPGFGTLAAHMLDSMLSESIEVEHERIRANNHLIRQSRNSLQDADGRRLREIKSLIIRPSQDLFSLAQFSLDSFPKSLRWAMRQLGVGKPDGNSIASFLMFDKSLSRPLLALGYADAMAQMSEITELLCDQVIEVPQSDLERSVGRA